MNAAKEGRTKAAEQRGEGILNVTRADQAVSVANKSITVVHFDKDEHGRCAILATQDPDRGPNWGDHSRGSFVRLGQQVEIFPGIEILINPQRSRRKVRIKIVAPEGVPITKGYPYERTPRLVVSNG